MAMHPLDVITPQQAQTLMGLFNTRVARSPQAVAYRYFDRAKQAWCELRWLEAATQVTRLRSALDSVGLRKGDRVAVMMRNCPLWAHFEQAALSLGLVVVPLYPNDRPDNVAYIIKDAQIKFLLIENGDQWQNVEPVMQEFPADFRVVSVEPLHARSEPRLSDYESWYKASTRTVQPVEGIGTDELATIVYTSGTTGRPKGVMLSHRNILCNAHAGISAINVYADDLFLSFLPLSHTLERTVGYYIPMMAGAAVAFARSVAELGEDLISVKPTVLITVPRIFERVYAKIQTQMQEKSPLARNLFKTAVNVGWRRFEFQQGRSAWHPGLLFWPLLNLLVAKKVMAKLGGRMRMSICGGSALSTPIARTFIGLGLPICQGYGLTESSPVISVNRLQDNIPESIGPALPDIEVKLAQNGELMTRNASIMLGYLNMPEATRNTVDSEGWLHTGDLAKIGDRGHIYITGRIKEILVLSNGEKVPPVDMEMAITLNPLFEQVVVIGEGKPYLCALIVLNAALWSDFAAKLGVTNAPASLKDERVQSAVLGAISTCLKQFPGYAQIRRVALSLEPWTVENALITASLKLQRAKIMDKFSADIIEMYRGH
ncbi:MAG: long-chain fatty acid--CoA ligase [Gammaproteobacteria bacterium]|nr:long-chain fatty acid--CoA ligase [Gammaproteobacteria bacterium]